MRNKLSFTVIFQGGKKALLLHFSPCPLPSCSLEECEQRGPGSAMPAAAPLRQEPHPCTPGTASPPHSPQIPCLKWDGDHSSSSTWGQGWFQVRNCLAQAWSCALHPQLHTARMWSPLVSAGTSRASLPEHRQDLLALLPKGEPAEPRLLSS